MTRPTRFDWLFRPQVADVDLPLSAEARFAEALAELPAVERSALALSEIGGLETDEIAERLGTDPALVRKLLARARESVRTSLATRGRRGLTALLPFQSWWQTGSSTPTLRAAGLVAAAVVAPTVAIGGAAADTPRAAVLRPDAPVARVLESPQRETLAPTRARVSLARPIPVTAVARREKVAGRAPRSVQPVARIQTRREALPTAPAQPARQRGPASEPSPSPRPAAPKPETVPLPEPLPLAPVPLPVELPVVPPTVPALPVIVPVPVPVPELSTLPSLP